MIKMVPILYHCIFRIDLWKQLDRTLDDSACLPSTVFSAKFSHIPQSNAVRWIMRKIALPVPWSKKAEFSVLSNLVVFISFAYKHENIREWEDAIDPAKQFLVLNTTPSSILMHHCTVVRNWQPSTMNAKTVSLTSSYSTPINQVDFWKQPDHRKMVGAGALPPVFCALFSCAFKSVVEFRFVEIFAFSSGQWQNGHEPYAFLSVCLQGRL